MNLTKLFTILFLVLVVAFAGIAVVWKVRQLVNPSIQVNINKETVIREVRNLNRLETASFTIEKVIDAGTTGNAIQQLLVGDRILLIAHGQVIAGFDLSKMADKDIEVTNKDISLTLPKPEILTTVLDSTQTRVYDRQHGLLNPGNKDLETRVRQEAESSIRTAACQGGILNTASDNARKQLVGLLKAFGFNTITIITPPGAC